MLYYFFFFKQKTAYEMRISDWSSDVCSSDLLIVAQDNLCCGPERADDPIDLGLFIFDELDARVGRTTSRNFDRVRRRYRHQRANDGGGERPHRRSEEHTSELQSLMRISYAVFCLKKKTNELLHEHI